MPVYKDFQVDILRRIFKSLYFNKTIVLKKNFLYVWIQTLKSL